MLNISTGMLILQSIDSEGDVEEEVIYNNRESLRTRQVVEKFRHAAGGAQAKEM